MAGGEISAKQLMTTMKKTLLILLASAVFACADDLQRWLDQQQQETQRWLDQHRIEQELQHIRWEAQEREAREQQNDYDYDWAE